MVINKVKNREKINEKDWYSLLSKFKFKNNNLLSKF